MQKTSLTALVRQQLKLAHAACSGRSSSTVYGGHEHHLRQTLIALTAGQTLNEHETPARRPSTSCTDGSAWRPVTRRGTAPPETC